jgi:hypothetical protein
LFLPKLEKEPVVVRAFGSESLEQDLLLYAGALISVGGFEASEGTKTLTQTITVTGNPLSLL